MGSNVHNSPLFTEPCKHPNGEKMVIVVLIVLHEKLILPNAFSGLGIDATFLPLKNLSNQNYHLIGISLHHLTKPFGFYELREFIGVNRDAAPSDGNSLNEARLFEHLNGFSAP
jgi:hypothetical protein